MKTNPPISDESHEVLRLRAYIRNALRTTMGLYRRKDLPIDARVLLEDTSEQLEHALRGTANSPTDTNGGQRNDV